MLSLLSVSGNPTTIGGSVMTTSEMAIELQMAKLHGYCDVRSTRGIAVQKLS